MDSTCLTVGGFSQPSVARAIIEQSGSAEIGLAQRFLWLFPQPTYSKFNSLEAIEEGFTDQLVDLLVKQWRPGKGKSPETRIFSLSKNSSSFEEYFDTVQERLETLASMDDLLSGMLSKSKGQILRVAASFHVLFQLGSEPVESVEEEDSTSDTGDTISDKEIAAAIDFVSLCCQQTAYMAGRGKIKDELRIIAASVAEKGGETSTESSEADLTYTLKLPGKRLKLTALLYAKKFRKYDNKPGALRAFKKLESLGLGKLETVSTKTGPQYIFVKPDVPESTEEKAELAKKLVPLNISFAEYSSILKQKEIVSPISGSKRKELPPSPEKNKQRTPSKASPKSTPSKRSGEFAKASGSARKKICMDNEQ